MFLLYIVNDWIWMIIVLCDRYHFFVSVLRSESIVLLLRDYLLIVFFLFVSAFALIFVIQIP